VKQQSVSEPWFANHSFGCGLIPLLQGQFRGKQQQRRLGRRLQPVFHDHRRAANQQVSRGDHRSPCEIAQLSPDELATVSKAITNQFGFQTAFVYPARLWRRSRASNAFRRFRRPKEYKTLDRLASLLGNNMDLVMGFGGFFGFFARLLLLSMNGCMRSGCLRPDHYCYHGHHQSVVLALTQMSTRSMKRMQALQPQVKGIQEKYKDDPRR